MAPKPSSRFVDDTPKGFVGLAIVGHGRETKQGESVLDLGAGVEADVANEAVWDFCAHQGFLEGAREEVVAERTAIPPNGRPPFSSDQRVGETRRFGVSVAKAHELDRSPCPFRVNSVLPRRALSSAMIALAASRMWPVERNSLRGESRPRPESRGGIGGYSRHRRRASHRSTVIVADDEHTSGVGRQRLQPCVLGEIDVLILVGVDPVELACPSRAIVRVVDKSQGRPEEEVAEVSRVGLPRRV